MLTFEPRQKQGPQGKTDEKDRLRDATNTQRKPRITCNYGGFAL